MTVKELLRRLILCDKNAEVEVGFPGDINFPKSWREIAGVMENGTNSAVLLIIRSKESK